MNYGNCIIEFELGTGKKGLIIASEEEKSTGLFISSKHRDMGDRDAQEAYALVMGLWNMLGVVPIRSTTTPMPMPTWGNHASFPGVSVSLKEIKWSAWRYKDDLDDGSYTQWELVLNTPLDEIEGAIADTGRLSDEFQALVTYELSDKYGFSHWGGQPQPGERFVNVDIRVDKDDASIVHVSNHWQRDI